MDRRSEEWLISAYIVIEAFQKVATFILNSFVTSNALTIFHPLNEFMKKMQHHVLYRIHQFGKVDRGILLWETIKDGLQLYIHTMKRRGHVDGLEKE